ncbi:phospholipid carrier-dependent glycosyltransferase [Planotetraspora thailandica]|nr:phospholipid carrier-dependent glycosyltransferase [Planotetraspora thailandica]
MTVHEMTPEATADRRPLPRDPYGKARALFRRHRLFTLVIALAAALRILMMAGYATAQLYWYDSFTYLDTANHLAPSGAFHPAGYSFFLRLLAPFHSVMLVAGVQHAMGLGVGLMIYLLLRRAALPAWGAAAATVPVLFDPAFLRLEHAVLSDMQVIFLTVAALALLLWRARPPIWACAAAGAALAVAGLTRTIAVPVLGLAFLYLLVRRMGRRRLAVLAVAGTLPLLGYATWYHQHNDRFALSGADGVALWARSMTFADCSVIKPPVEEAKLCPNGTMADAASEYVWAPGASLNVLPGGRFANNDLARSFALHAIAAQPLDYLGDVVRDTSLAFARKPVAHPLRTNPALSFFHGSSELPDYPLVGKVRAEYDSDIRGLASVEPYGSILAAYRYPTFLHGPLFGLALIVGVAGMLAGLGRRRDVTLLWAVSMFLLVAPVATLDFDNRYVLPAVPVACLAAGLAAKSLAERISRMRGSG